MLKAGLFRTLMDVLCFDHAAIQCYQSDPRHQSMSAALYAGPHIGGAVVDRVDAVVLSAAEVDLAFNVNVTTRSEGLIIDGSGGHAGIAAGAKLTVIATRLTAAGFPKIVPEVGTLTTPGDTVDVLVTDGGIAVDLARAGLPERLRDLGCRSRPWRSWRLMRRQPRAARHRSTRSAAAWSRFRSMGTAA